MPPRHPSSDGSDAESALSPCINLWQAEEYATSPRLDIGLDSDEGPAIEFAVGEEAFRFPISAHDLRSLAARNSFVFKTSRAACSVVLFRDQLWIELVHEDMVLLDLFVSQEAFRSALRQLSPSPAESLQVDENVREIRVALTDLVWGPAVDEDVEISLTGNLITVRIGPAKE